MQESNVGLLGLLLTGRGVPVLRVPIGAGEYSVSNSSDILRVLHGLAIPNGTSAFLEADKEKLKLESKLDRCAHQRYLSQIPARLIHPSVFFFVIIEVFFLGYFDPINFILYHS